jgi:hypothetical protein
VSRSPLTPPERSSFKPMHLWLRPNSLTFLTFNIRTKTGVVRLRRRKWAERDEKRPEMGLAAAARGSDKWPGMAAFCGIPTGDKRRKKMSRLDVLAEGAGFELLVPLLLNGSMPPGLVENNKPPIMDHNGGGGLMMASSSLAALSWRTSPAFTRLRRQLGITRDRVSFHSLRRCSCWVECQPRQTRNTTRRGRQGGPRRLTSGQAARRTWWEGLRWTGSLREFEAKRRRPPNVQGPPSG